jgi:hypothetical protein
MISLLVDHLARYDLLLNHPGNDVIYVNLVIIIIAVVMVTVMVVIISIVISSVIGHYA